MRHCGIASICHIERSSQKNSMTKPWTSGIIDPRRLDIDIAGFDIPRLVSNLSRPKCRSEMVDKGVVLNREEGEMLRGSRTAASPSSSSADQNREGLLFGEYFPKHQMEVYRKPSNRQERTSVRSTKRINAIMSTIKNPTRFARCAFKDILTASPRTW